LDRFEHLTWLIIYSPWLVFHRCCLKYLKTKRWRVWFKFSIRNCRRLLNEHIKMCKLLSQLCRPCLEAPCLYIWKHWKWQISRTYLKDTLRWRCNIRHQQRRRSSDRNLCRYSGKCRSYMYCNLRRLQEIPTNSYGEYAAIKHDEG